MNKQTCNRRSVELRVTNNNKRRRRRMLQVKFLVWFNYFLLVQFKKLDT